METTASTLTTSLRLKESCAAVRALDLPEAALPARDAALEVAEIVRTLDADDEVVVAAMLQPLLEENFLDADAAAKRFGAEATRLARALSQLVTLGCRPIGPRSAASNRPRPRRF